MVENVQVQPLKAKVYLAEDYPLVLQDQIMPIIDLMVSPAYYQWMGEGLGL